MPSNWPRYQVDARHYTFNKANRDQFNIHQHYHFHCFDDPRIRQQSKYRGTQKPTSGPQTLASYQHSLPMARYHAVSGVDSGVDLVDQIKTLLINYRDFSKSRREFELELISLQQILTLTGLAIHVYNDRQLGQTLFHTLSPEVERSCVILQRLLGSIDDTWLGFRFTSIVDLWRQIWWGRWDGDEYDSWRKELSHSRQLLQGFLVALHS